MIFLQWERATTKRKEQKLRPRKVWCLLKCSTCQSFGIFFVPTKNTKRRTMLIREIIQKKLWWITTFKTLRDHQLTMSIATEVAAKLHSNCYWSQCDQCRSISLALVDLFRLSQLLTQAILATAVSLSSTPLGLTSVAKMADVEWCDRNNCYIPRLSLN